MTRDSAVSTTRPRPSDVVPCVRDDLHRRSRLHSAAGRSLGMDRARPLPGVTELTGCHRRPALVPDDGELFGSPSSCPAWVSLWRGTTSNSASGVAQRVLCETVPVSTVHNRHVSGQSRIPRAGRGRGLMSRCACGSCRAVPAARSAAIHQASRGRLGLGPVTAARSGAAMEAAPAHCCVRGRRIASPRAQSGLVPVPLAPVRVLPAVLAVLVVRVGLVGVRIVPRQRRVSAARAG